MNQLTLHPEGLDEPKVVAEPMNLLPGEFFSLPVYHSTEPPVGYLGDRLQSSGYRDRCGNFWQLVRVGDQVMRQTI